MHTDTFMNMGIITDPNASTITFPHINLSMQYQACITFASNTSHIIALLFVIKIIFCVARPLKEQDAKKRFDTRIS